MRFVSRVAPLLEGQLGSRLHRSDGAGIVEADVEPTEALDSRVDQRLKVRRIPNIARQRDSLTAFPLDFSDQRIEFGLAPGRDDNTSAFARKQSGRCIADAGTRTGDDCDFIVETIHSRSPRFRIELPILGVANLGELRPRATRFLQRRKEKARSQRSGPEAGQRGTWSWRGGYAAINSPGSVKSSDRLSATARWVIRPR